LIVKKHERLEIIIDLGFFYYCVYHESKEVGDDHQHEAEDEADDSAAPGVRVEIVVLK
jgi:hypothetical protein